MYSFLVQIIFVASLSVIIFLFARALPRISREEDAKLKFDLADKFAKKIPLEQFDKVMHQLSEKWLRKLRVWILRLDNIVNGYLDQLKKYSQAKEEKENLKEKMDLLKSDEVIENTEKKSKEK